MSVELDEADIPDTASACAHAARGYESVRRDVETTKYFLWRPGVIMVQIWGFLEPIQWIGMACGLWTLRR